MQGLARRMRRASHRAAPAGEADYRQGLAYGKDGRWQDALRSFERAVARNPSDSVFWLNLAHAQMRCGHYDDGAQSAQKGARLAPQSEPALAVAAECLNAAHRQTETVALLGGTDLANVRDYHVHFELGQALHHLGRLQEAADHYLAGLSRKPDHMAGHVQLGNVFNRLQLHEEARECYKTAIAVGGDAVQLMSGMAFEDLHACRWDRLREDLPELMRRGSDGNT